jgi:hypothetical protein
MIYLPSQTYLCFLERFQDLIDIFMEIFGGL